MTSQAMVTTSPTIVVRLDRVVQLTPIQTTAFDEWRAAIALRGEFDAAKAMELRDHLSHHIEAGRRVIRVDAAEVDFMDCAAVRELVEATERCRADHGSLILTRVPRPVMRLIALAGFEPMLLIDNANQDERVAASGGATVSG